MYDVIIVGGGPAGLTSALYCARANLNTLLIEKMFAGGQMATTDTLENYPGFEELISGSELAMRMEKQAKKFGVQIVNDDVLELILDEKVKEIKTPNNQYQSKAVILCMGASPKELGISKEKEFRGSGVSYCATCDGSFYEGQKVAIVGGGDTAAKDAIYLSRICKKVYIIHRRNSMRAAKVLQDKLFSIENIEFIGDAVITEIKGQFGVEGITIRNVKTDKLIDIDSDGLFVAIGVTPNTELVEGKVKLNDMKYIITDESMQTSIPGVFAAGDIREKVLRQVITAASDGAVAAYMAEEYISSIE